VPLPWAKKAPFPAHRAPQKTPLCPPAAPKPLHQQPLLGLGKQGWVPQPMPTRGNKRQAKRLVRSASASSRSVIHSGPASPPRCHTSGQCPGHTRWLTLLRCFLLGSLGTWGSTCPLATVPRTPWTLPELKEHGLWSGMERCPMPFLRRMAASL
jgi:hypothetical protein